MKERINAIRKTLGFTQQELADRLNIQRGSIASYETGRISPSCSTISLICREFNVSEEWFRHGTGDMFISVPSDEAIDSFVSKAKKDNGFKKSFLSTLSKLDEGEWDFVKKFMESALEEMGTI